MAKMLSRAEIAALIAAPSEGRRERRDSHDLRPVIPYNFRRPDRVSKEQLHSLQFLHERYARNVGTQLSAYMRTITEVSVISVEQFAYSEFLASLANPTAFYALAIPPFDDLGALEISPPIAFAVVDRMLGGIRKSAAPNRALTDIEQNVVDSVVKLILEGLTEAWRPIVNLAFGIRGRETRPQMLQVAAPNETVLMVVFDMKVGETSGLANLCLPASLVEANDSHFTKAWQRHRREPTATERQWVQQQIARVPATLSAVLEASVTTRELLEMQPGDVVSLGVPVHKPIDLRVGPVPKFTGRLAVESGRLGVHVEDHYVAGATRDGMR